MKISYFFLYLYVIKPRDNDLLIMIFSCIHNILQLFLPTAGRGIFLRSYLSYLVLFFLVCMYFSLSNTDLNVYHIGFSFFS